jgi:hypothetical protein
VIFLKSKIVYKKYLYYSEFISYDDLKRVKFSNLTLEEVITLLEEDSENEEAPEIFIEPPNDGNLSDVDSADEDAPGKVDNLSKGQLLASVEVRFNEDVFDDSIFNEDENLLNEIDDNENVIRNKMPQHFVQERNWREGDLQAIPSAFPFSNFQNYASKSPVELFELMITDDIIDMIVSQTNNYAMYKDNINPQITNNEIRCFLGILFLTGILQKILK